MGIVEVVKKGFTQASKLMNVIIIFFAFNAVIGLITLPLANPDKAGNPGIIAISIISSILFFLLFIFLQGGALGLVKDQIKTSQSSMSQFVEYGKKYYVKILGLLLLYIAAAIAVVLVLSLLSTGVLLLGDNIVTRSLIAAIVTAVAISIITLLVYPIYVIVVDDIGAVEALKKGIKTARSNFWVTLGLFVVMLIVSLLISVVIGFIVGLVSAPLPTGVGQVLMTIVNAAVQSYIPIVMMIAFMTFYMSLSSDSASEAQAPTPQVGE